MAGRLVHCHTVTHGGAALGEAVAVNFSERGDPLVLGPCDNDTWPARVIATNRLVQGSVNLKHGGNAAAAAVAVGASGTLLATGAAPDGGASDLTVTILHAVITGRRGRFVSQGEADFTLDFQAYSDDGATSPMSWA